MFQKTNHNFFISEELISKDFSKIVDPSYFPSKNIDDVLNHELGGHKKHWEAVKKYKKKNNVPEIRAKEDLENNLRKYIINQKNSDIMYIRKNVSRNADYSFEIKKSLNELIADAVVLIEQGTIKDSYLKELVMEVLNYDD